MRDDIRTQLVINPMSNQFVDLVPRSLAAPAAAAAAAAMTAAPGASLTAAMQAAAAAASASASTSALAAAAPGSAASPPQPPQPFPLAQQPPVDGGAARRAGLAAFGVDERLVRASRRCDAESQPRLTRLWPRAA
jgi:hypothetical protein